MILSPQQLWKNYDRKNVPLAVSVLSSGETASAVSHYLYFNGDKTIDGVVRIYAKLYEPKGFAINDSAVIVFDDPEKTVDDFDPRMYIENGFSVLVIDYAGARDDKVRYTIYPKSASYSNFSFNTNVLGVGDENANPARSCWYTWATNGLRAVTLLEDRQYRNIFMLGYGCGGSQVWKTAYFENTITAGAVVFSTPLPLEMTLTYRAALSAVQYSLLVKSPIFVQTTSNEQNNSLDMMSELFETSKDKGSLFSVSERANRAIDPSRLNNAVLWFLAILRGERIPAPPSLTAKGSQNHLYFNATADLANEIETAELFVAHGQTNSAFRNWRAAALQSVGEGEYLSQISVLGADKPVYAFLNVRYKSGLCLSSAVVKAIPAALGVPSQPVNLKRLIYEVGMGFSDWMILHETAGEPAKLLIEKGPFELEGIRSSSGKLSTFRLADPQFAGTHDSVLQLTVFSASRQDILFRVTATDKIVEYTAKRTLLNPAAWSKITLSPGDFKGSGGSLQNWSELLTFELISDEPVLVNSMLWV